MSKLNDMIELEGFFLHARNEIIQPDRYVSSTKYFWDKWAPELGPNLTILIMQLRKHCFHNRHTGEKRDSIRFSLTNLSKECGLSERTIRRELSKTISKKFIKIHPHYKYDETLRKKVRYPNIYQVAMDDPIHSSDEHKLLQHSEKKEALEEVEKTINDLPAKLTFRSKKDVDNSGPTGQIDRHIYTGQIDRVNVNTFKNTMNVNVQNKNNKENVTLNSNQEMLLDKIIALTEDKKSESFFKQVVQNYSQAKIEQAIEDVKTYISSGRKVKNKGALFTSRIKSYNK